MATATMQPFDPSSRRKSFGIFSRQTNPKPAVQYSQKLITKQRPASYQHGVGPGNLIHAQTFIERKSPPMASPIDVDRPLPPHPKVSTRPVSLSATPRSYEPSSPGTSTVSTSTAASSLFDESDMGSKNPRTGVVIHAGEVTSTGLLKTLRRREYLVLTEAHLLRFRSHAKAAEAFPQLNSSLKSTGRSMSFGPGAMTGEVNSDQIVIHLNQIVAVHETEKMFIQIDHIDELSGVATSTVLQLSVQSEVDSWLRSLCRTVRLPTYTTLPFTNKVVDYVAAKVKQEKDYSPDNVMIFRAVHRLSDKRSQTKLSGSSDDLAKNVSTICYLAVGIHKIHLIPVPKPTSQRSSTMLSPVPTTSFGILTLCSLVMNSDTDDSFTLRFRSPCRPYQNVYLASSCAAQIIQTIRHAADFLRPQWSEPSFTLKIPEKLIDQPFPEVDYDEGYNCFKRTLEAYCAAYEVDQSVIAYRTDETAEDGPLFQLLPPNHTRRQKYSVLELLAVLRTLRWNEAFGSLSFAGVSLQQLKGVYDSHGTDMEPYRTRSGRKLNTKGQRRSLLVLELRAIAACSSKLRRINFAGCLDPPRPFHEEDHHDDVESGCELIEAVLPLSKKGLTNVDWMSFSGIQLDQADIAWIVDAAVDKTCHIRGLELARCGLTERSISLILESLAAQEKTLEGLDISGNPGRLNTSNLNSLCDMLRVFPGMRVLRLADLKLASADYSSNYAQKTANSSPIRPSFNRSISLQIPLPQTASSTSSLDRPTTLRAESTLSVNTFMGGRPKDNPIIPEEVLMKWRLQELDLSGTPLNGSTVDALSVYLNSSASDCLTKLNLNNCGVKAGDLAVLLGCLAREDGKVRNLHLYVNRLQITPDHNKLVDAIKKGLSPKYLTISNVDYPDEEMFRKLIKALAVNNTIEYLDLSRVYLPSDANADTIQALSELFAKNDTLKVLNISGGYGRIEDGRLGAGLNRAFNSLDENKTLRILKVEQQRLGPQGAMVLAKMLESNTSLREVHCSNNHFNLQGVTALVGACHVNKSITALPGLERDRKEQLDKLRIDLKKTIEVPEPPTSRLSLLGSLSSMDRRKSVRSLKSLTSRNSHDSDGANGLSEEQVDEALKVLTTRWDDQTKALQKALRRNMAGDHDNDSRNNTPKPATALAGIAIAM